MRGGKPTLGSIGGTLRERWLGTSPGGIQAVAPGSTTTTDARLHKPPIRASTSPLPRAGTLLNSGRAAGRTVGQNAGQVVGWAEASHGGPKVQSFSGVRRGPRHVQNGRHGPIDRREKLCNQAQGVGACMQSRLCRGSGGYKSAAPVAESWYKAGSGSCKGIRVIVKSRSHTLLRPREQPPNALQIITSSPTVGLGGPGLLRPV